MIGRDRRITKRVTILILLLTKRLHNFGILNLLNYVFNVIEQFLHNLFCVKYNVYANNQIVRLRH